MELILMVSVKKFSFGANGRFDPKMAHHHNSGSTLRIFFFEILHNRRGQEVHENYINGFFKKKKSFWANGFFWARKHCNFMTLDPL